jgi:hypothetical protein
MRRALSVLLVVWGLALVAASALAQGSAVASYTLFGPQRLTGGVTYTAAPQVIGGWLDITRIADFNSSDVFVAVDGEPGFVLMSSIEYSTDGVNWTPVGYENIDRYSGRAGIVPSVRVQTEDGAVYFEKQNAGTYLRVRLEGSGVYTPTVKVMYSNKMYRQSIER